MTSCAVCKSWTGLSVCTGCRGTWYCGGEHQKTHWKSHKSVCKGIQAAVAAGGMHKDVITPGAGPVPQHGARVQCNYVGTFDASKAPFAFRLGEGEVIKGWDKCIATMKEGEKCIVYLTPENAYGARGAPPDIPPNMPLVFEITLVSAGAK